MIRWSVMVSGVATGVLVATGLVSARSLTGLSNVTGQPDISSPRVMPKSGLLISVMIGRRNRNILFRPAAQK
ncbi:hypothetical protein AB1K62_06250 [Parasphingorhabdus sp. JC815]|uniref:hypothetical protein n=1 Tax=Parasphingorhabdus sp. JC815 TaxID=3232140 RepID=UPI00345AB21E